jgi:N-acetylmuramoyl-L-alanine amidase
MKRIFAIFFICLLALPSSVLSQEKGLTVKAVRHFSYAAFTRVVFEIEAAAPYVLTKTGDGRGLLFSAYEGSFAVKSPLPAIADGVVSGMETKEEGGKLFVFIRLGSQAGEVKDFVLRGPDRIVLDIARTAAMIDPVPGVPAEKPAVIMLDPGHGGRDTGIVTSRGQEKSIARDIAVAVKKILQRDPRLKVVLTRDRDAALTLDQRAAASNSAGARIFVSIHAAAGNGGRVYIPDPGEDGGQTQRPVTRDFLSFETGSEQRENLWRRQQAAHTPESASLGRALARQFAAGNTAEPVQAPLAQLKAVDAAAVMIEVGMEAGRIKTAESIAKGIEQYVRENR